MAPVKSWKVIKDGVVLVSHAPTRGDAIARAFDPDLLPRMEKATLDQLLTVHKRTAGWAWIEFDGYRVEPVLAKNPKPDKYISPELPLERALRKTRKRRRP